MLWKHNFLLWVCDFIMWCTKLYSHLAPFSYIQVRWSAFHEKAVCNYDVHSDGGMAWGCKTLKWTELWGLSSISKLQIHAFCTTYSTKRGKIFKETGKSLCGRKIIYVSTCLGPVIKATVHSFSLTSKDNFSVKIIWHYIYPKST